MNELEERPSKSAHKTAWKLELERCQAYKDREAVYVKNVRVRLPVNVKEDSKASKVKAAQAFDFNLRHASWLNWKLKKNNVFENQEEERKAFNRCYIFSPGSRKSNMLFQYGLRYIPGEKELNIYRTVMIDFVPQHMAISEILHSIRGGAVHSAYLADTVAINGFKTAKITFINQKGAMNFFKCVQKDGFYVGINVLPVYVVRSPSYPPELSTTDIQGGPTRCLKVRSNGSKFLKKEIYGLLSSSRLGTYVDNFGVDNVEGEVSIRFISVDAALLTVGILRHREWSITFGDDPCAA
ncbi:hypothetical protein N7495_007670 [Penicillium taxi]|uniref:uncharacterized protein n=1 Tax=Penicillium taxi TaxID=168475 RepID=UPI0025459D64|nr:uncharacterized protein N7495_007670 [Penicillium taxi]KAJ5887629.1 hypothetical protein N7495_007670 [Penicillium taxi]